MTTSDFSTRSNFHLFQNKHNIRQVYSKTEFSILTEYNTIDQKLRNSYMMKQKW